MLLKPIKTKFAKAHKGRLSYTIRMDQTLTWGNFGLVSRQPARLTAAQIHAAFTTISRSIKSVSGSAAYIRVFPHIPVSAKPAEVRMGKGKGAVDYYMCRIRQGAIIFEVLSSDANLASISLKLAASKLPFRTSIISSASNPKKTPTTITTTPITPNSTTV